MKKLATILLLFFTVACSNKVVEFDKDLDHISKVDSVLLKLVKQPSFPNSSITKSLEDTTGTPHSDGLELIKEIYVPYLGLTFEHWLSWDCHDRIEIIVCHNERIYTGIPFYFQHIREKDSLCLDEFCKGLNHSIKVFFSDSSDYKYYQYSLISTIFENIFIYKFVEYRKHEIPFLIDKTQFLIENKYGLYFRPECTKNAIENLNYLNDLPDDFIIYDIPKRYSQLKVSLSSKEVSIHVINSQCFFEQIF